MQLQIFFTIHKGHQITDFELYSTEGIIPVYTGDNEIKGYWNKTMFEDNLLPCLTYPTKAFAGNIFIQKESFDANNTAVLIPKKEWKDKIRLEWFKYYLPKLFFEAMTSKEGVSYLNKAIVKEIEINLPDIKQQDIEIRYFSKLSYLKKKLQHILESYNKLFAKNIIVDDSSKENFLLSDIFNYISRNDSLSEEGIYKNNPINKAEGVIKVLSGGSDDVFYGEISLKTPNVHYIKDRQVLHLVTRGKAGKLTYMPKGTYATNTNAFILYIRKEKFDGLGIKNDKDEEIYLKFMKIYLEPKFVELASYADVAVFPLTDVMKSMQIPKMKLSQAIKEIVKKMDDILGNYRNTLNLYNKVKGLINKNINN